MQESGRDVGNSSSTDAASGPRLAQLSTQPLSKLSVLMPIYNERWTLRTIVDRVLTSPVPLEIELVAVDDCSSDGSWELLVELASRDARIRAYRQPKNGGKGAAVRAAIAHMTGDVAIVQDADLEYDPYEFPALLAPILAGKADAVFGSRYSGNTRKVQFYPHTLVNRFLTWASNLCTGLDLTDMETCYKMVRADVLRELRLRSHTFTFEPELTSRLAQWGARIHEVPISYEGRSFQEGKKIRPVDGLKAIGELLRCQLFDRQFSGHPRFLELKHFDSARKQTREIQKLLREQVGRNVLQLGAGIGSLSAAFFHKPRVVLVENDEVCAHYLQHRFASRENLAIERGTPKCTADLERWRRDRIDTVVTSHTQQDELDAELLSRCAELLPANGTLIALVSLEPGTSEEQACELVERLGLRFKNAGFDVAVVQQVEAVGWLGGNNSLVESPHPATHSRLASLGQTAAKTWRALRRRLSAHAPVLAIVAHKPLAFERRIAA